VVLIPVRCPHCGSDQVVKRGKTENDKQRYCCQQQDCPVKTFIVDYDYNGCLPAVKQQIIARALKGSGSRDTARVLESSPTTVINELKKSILPRTG
jgi:transposase-like protein